MIIKILGAGCSGCAALENKTKEAVKKLKLAEVDVVKISDVQSIITYDVLSLPALIIDDKVVLSGKNPSVEEIMNLINGHRE